MIRQMRGVTLCFVVASLGHGYLLKYADGQGSWDHLVVQRRWIGDAGRVVERYVIAVVVVDGNWVEDLPCLLSRSGAVAWAYCDVVAEGLVAGTLLLEVVPREGRLDARPQALGEAERGSLRAMFEK